MNYTKLSATGELVLDGALALVPVIDGKTPNHVVEMVVPTNTDGSGFSYGRIPKQAGFKPGQGATITVERDSTTTEILPTIDATVYEDASGFYWVAKLANDPRVVGAVHLRITVTQ